MTAREGSFRFNGHRIAYAEFGEGERALVLAHGLLMNRHMYDRLAPAMATRGIRVISVDLLGHGASDKPTDMRAYNMPAFGDQLAALFDHLGLDRPIVGGTSLGANAALELATRHPRTARGLFIEMPVLDNALVAAGLIFLPILLVAAGREARPARRRRGHQPHPPHALPGRHPARLDPAPAGGLGGGARGDPVRPHRAAARGAPADRTAGAGDRPPRRPAASRSPTPTWSPRRCRGRAWSTPSRSSSGASTPTASTTSSAAFIDDVYASEQAENAAGAAA